MSLCITYSFLYKKYKKIKYKTKKRTNVKTFQEPQCEWSRVAQDMCSQTGFFRTSISALLEVSGPALRLERRDSLRDFTTGSVGVPVPDWTTRLVGTSAAAWSQNSSMTAGSSVGREERLHVDGRGVFTSSRISSLDLEGPVPLPAGLSSGQRLSFSVLPRPAGRPSAAETVRQMELPEKLLSRIIQMIWAVILYSFTQSLLSIKTKIELWGSNIWTIN